MKGAKKNRKRTSPKQALPQGWDEEKLRRVATHYENQSEDEAAAEDEAAFRKEDQTVMIVPTRLVPEVRRLLGRNKTAS